MRQIIIKSGEDGSWPAVLVKGNPKSQRYKIFREAIEGYLRVLQQDGEPILEDIPILFEF